MGRECPKLSQMLSDVRQELKRRFTVGHLDACIEPVSRATPSDSTQLNNRRTSNFVRAGSSQVILDALTEDDWETILYPISELGPYLNCATSANENTNSFSSQLELLDHYVQCRCAELPMRLQTEALLLRKHEELQRKNMKQLILLSQYVAYAAPLLDEPLGCTGPSRGEFEERLNRCLDSITRLEVKVLQNVCDKRRCAQRMLLLSSVVNALLDRLHKCEEVGLSKAQIRRQ